MPRRARTPGANALGVDAVVNRDNAIGELGKVLAHLLRRPLGDAHERRRAVGAKAQPLADPLDSAPPPAHDQRCSGMLAGWALGAADLVAVVNRDHVDAVEHDRARRLNDAPSPPAHASEPASMNHG